MELAAWVGRIASLPGVERCDRPDGSVSLAVHGLEFARATGEELFFGIDEKHPAGAMPMSTRSSNWRKVSPGCGMPVRRTSRIPSIRGGPEAWLESQVRVNVEELDAMLLPQPVYGQVPQFAAGDRSVIDLLAADRDGRLTVIEVKASQDIHLPLQALDYWMRVKWHLDRAEFSGRGYFPGIALIKRAPRLLLVAPALEYHPTNETILRFFAPDITLRGSASG